MSKKSLRVFNDATAIITGGASGIGRALAEELVKRGAEVILADLQFDLAEEVASKIRATGGKASAVKLDVTDFLAVEKVIQETVDRTGRLDFMFNNAGIAIMGPSYLHSIEDWNKCIDVNLRGVVNGVHMSYKVMLKQGFGHIVNTASVFGLCPLVTASSYSTTKHAVVGLSNSLRAEAGIEGIRVSALCPGGVRTPILGSGGKYGKRLYKEQPDDERDIKRQQKFIMLPEVFASIALDAIAKNKAIIIESTLYKIWWWAYRLSPSLGRSLAQKMYIEKKKKFIQ